MTLEQKPKNFTRVSSLLLLYTLPIIVHAFSTSRVFTVGGSRVANRLTTKSSIVTSHAAAKDDCYLSESTLSWEIDSLKSFEEASNGDEPRFATGKELRQLRARVENLRENVKWSAAAGDQRRVEEILKAIEKTENKDPEIVYARALSILDSVAEKEKNTMKTSDILRVEQEVASSRSAIPRFHLEGLWVGKFHNDQFELVNVTYAGDTLIATKLTGDEKSNVPRGEILFSADLSPQENIGVDGKNKPLPTITVSRAAADKWGIDQVKCYPGKGQVLETPEEDYVDAKLVMFQEHFSFVWVPTKEHVFFARPGIDLTMRLLRDTLAREDEIENAKRADSVESVDLLPRVRFTHELEEWHAKQLEEEARRQTYTDYSLISSSFQ